MPPAVSPLVRFLIISTALIASSACRAQVESRPADREGVTRSVTVSWADLNLAAPQGTRELYKRISAAAHVVCTAIEVDRVYESAFRKRCLEEAIDRAVAEVSDSRLTALHQAATRHPHAPAGTGVWARESGHPG